MTGDLTYRRVVDADRDAIIELLRVSLGRELDARYEALFAWKHEENAFGPSPAWVACDGELLVGFRALMRWEFRDGARIVRAVRAVDTATHPDYQGLGIFTRLTLRAIDELAAEGVEFVFNTPNDQSRPGYLKMGWQVVGQLPTLVRPTRWRHVARIAKARVPADRWSVASHAGRDALKVLADGDALSELLAVRGPTRGLGTNLTVEYLRWRFGTPLLGYRAIASSRGLEHGVAIFRIRARGPAREAALVAVITRDGDRRTESELVRAVAHAADADYVLALGGGPLRPGGLVQLPRTGPLMTWRPVTATAPPARWDLTLGDIELF